MPKEQSKENQILDIMAQKVDSEIVVGEKTYKLYPISLGKLSLLTKHQEAVQNLMALISAKDRPEQDITDELEKAITGVIEIFHILISPNDGKEPEELSAEQKKSLRWQISTANLFQIMMYLQTAHFPGDLLKNAVSPRQEKEKDQDGEIS